MVRSVCFSPDGRRLASAHNASLDKTAKVWNATTGELQFTLNGHAGQVISVAFSPDGKRLATASNDGMVPMWDTNTGQELFRLKGHSSYVVAAAFSSDGKRLASASADKTVKVWDAITGQEMLTLKGHAHKVGSVCFSPDGQRLASASDDNTVKVWDSRPWTPELRTESQTRNLLTAKRDQAKSLEDLQAGIRSNKTISDQVRQRALEWASMFWQERARQQKQQSRRPTVTALMKQYDNDKNGVLGREEVEKNSFARQFDRWDADADGRVSNRDIVAFRLRFGIAADGTSLKLTTIERSSQLNAGSWSIVKQPGLPADKYQSALKLIIEANSLVPDYGTYLNTLGIAQYRVQKYKEALATLTRSTSLNASRFSGRSPYDLVFLAMTRFQLGEQKQTTDLLEIIKTIVAQAEQKDAQLDAFIKEAESLIQSPRK